MFLSIINGNSTIYYYIFVNHLPFSSRLLTSLILNLAAVTEMQKKQSSCYVTCFYVYIICFFYVFVMIVLCSKMYHGVREIYMTEKLFIFVLLEMSDFRSIGKCRVCVKKKTNIRYSQEENVATPNSIKQINIENINNARSVASLRPWLRCMLLYICLYHSALLLFFI